MPAGSDVELRNRPSSINQNILFIFSLFDSCNYRKDNAYH